LFRGRLDAPDSTRLSGIAENQTPKWRIRDGFGLERLPLTYFGGSSHFLS
jgi:hypothetical protein